jgi:hypothetical protein
MKVVLEDTEQALYVGKHGHWTRHVEKAIDFQDIPTAIDCALLLGLKNVRPVVKSEDSPWELRLLSLDQVL